MCDGCDVLVFVDDLDCGRGLGWVFVGGCCVWIDCDWIGILVLVVGIVVVMVGFLEFG